MCMYWGGAYIYMPFCFYSFPPTLIDCWDPYIPSGAMWNQWFRTNYGVWWRLQRRATLVTDGNCGGSRQKMLRIILQWNEAFPFASKQMTIRIRNRGYGVRVHWPQRSIRTALAVSQQIGKERKVSLPSASTDVNNKCPLPLLVQESPWYATGVYCFILW